MPNDASSTIGQQLLGELTDEGLDLGFQCGREHSARTFPGNLCQRVLDGTRLTLSRWTRRSRAPYAGLSFTHFQNAFLLRPNDRAREVAQALEAAGQGLAADERDPTAHCVMGRALWLRGADDEAVAELQTSVALSPSFSLGHYTLGFVNSQSGDAAAAIEAADLARALSPFDPLLFAMLGSRAMALFRLGAYDEAATSAPSAAERPNAQIHIRPIAALCLAAAGRLDEARDQSARILASVPGYTIDDFMTAFRFPPDTRALYRKLARLIGLD